MPTNLPDQGWTIPAPADLANNPLAFTDFAADVQATVVLRYPNTATRDAFNGGRVAGDISFTTGNTWYDRWTGTKWLPIMPLTTILAAPQIVNNSTAFVATALSITLPAISATWTIEAWLYHASSTTADIKFTFAAPGGGATLVWGQVGLATTATTNTGDMTNDASGTPTTAISAAGIGTADFINTLLTGQITTVGVASTVQVQFAQNTLDATNTTLFTNSWLRLSPVA